MLHTMFEVQSIHLQAALWECHCHRSKRYPPFESGLPHPLGITEVPGVYFFPLLLLYVGKFFFSPDQDKFFFSSHVGQVFFFLLCVGRTGSVPCDREGVLGVREADLRARQREGLSSLWLRGGARGPRSGPLEWRDWRHNAIGDAFDDPSVAFDDASNALGDANDAFGDVNDAFGNANDAFGVTQKYEKNNTLPKHRRRQMRRSRR